MAVKTARNAKYWVIFGNQLIVRRSKTLKAAKEYARKRNAGNKGARHNFKYTVEKAKF